MECILHGNSNRGLGLPLIHWENSISISFHIEWDMIVVTVCLSILNQMEFHLVQNRKENCHHNHIPFNVKGKENIIFPVQLVTARAIPLTSTPHFPSSSDQFPPSQLGITVAIPTRFISETMELRTQNSRRFRLSFDQSSFSIEFLSIVPKYLVKSKVFGFR